MIMRGNIVYNNWNRIPFFMANKPPNSKPPSEDYGNVPLHCACNDGHLEVAQWLVKQGAPLRVRNKDREVPIDLARHHGFTELATWLAVGTPFPCDLTNRTRG